MDFDIKQLLGGLIITQAGAGKLPVSCLKKENDEPWYIYYMSFLLF
jgi:hypothetical protein